MELTSTYRIGYVSVVYEVYVLVTTVSVDLQNVCGVQYVPFLQDPCMYHTILCVSMYCSIITGSGFLLSIVHKK